MARAFEVFASHSANCIRLAGNKYPSRGTLLYRIYCRAKKSKMKDRHGEAGWAVLTPAEWEKDTGLSISQYDRAVEYLKENKLIIYKNQHKGKPLGNPPLWAKIPEEIRIIIESPELRARGWVNSVGVVGVPDPNHEVATPIYNCVNKNKSVKDKSVTEINSGSKKIALKLKKDSRRKLKIKLNEDNYESNVISIKGEKMKKGAGRGIEVRDKKNHGKSVGELHKESQTTVFCTTVIHVTDLSYHWVDLHSEYFDHVDIGAWSSKETGYATSILVKCKKRKGDDWGVYLAGMFTAVFQNWDDYAEFAAAQTGGGLAYSPDIGLLAANFQTLTVWYGVFTAKEKEIVHVHADDPYRSRSGGRLDMPKQRVKVTEDKD